MTEDEARKVAQHCIDAWPNGPKAYIWRELLEGLDYGPAVGAYKALVREAEKTPTPGRFMAHYAHLARGDDAPRQVRIAGNEISLGEYLERLALRAASSHEAQAEYDRWTRHLAPGGAKYSSHGGPRLSLIRTVDDDGDGTPTRLVDPGANPL